MAQFRQHEYYSRFPGNCHLGMHFINKGEKFYYHQGRHVDAKKRQHLSNIYLLNLITLKIKTDDIVNSGIGTNGVSSFQGW